MHMFENSKSRLDAISDGVFAVVLTLMVLDIKVPKTLTKVDLYATGFSVVIYFISFAGSVSTGSFTKNFCTLFSSQAPIFWY